MKKLKMFSILIILVSILFIGKVNAAFPDSITILSDGNDGHALTLNDSLSVIDTDSEAYGMTGKPYPRFHLKRAIGNNITYNINCLTGLGTDRPIEDTSCSINNNYYSTKESFAVAYMLDYVEGLDLSAKEEYYWKEVLTIAVIPGDGGKQYYDTNSRLNYKSESGNTTYTYYDKYKNTPIPALQNKTISQLVTAARTYADNVNTTPASITISDSSKVKDVNGQKTVNLDFTLSNGKYCSSVTIDSNFPYNFSSITNTKFKTALSNNKYTICIDSTDVKLGEKQSFSVTATAKNEYLRAVKYNCGSSYQEVTISKADKKTLDDSIVFKGEVTNYGFKLNKIDDYGNKVKGAKFELKTQTQKTNNSDGTIKSTDKNGAITFDKLDAGTYYLTEYETPDIYNKNTKEYKIVVAANGKVTATVNDKKVDVDGKNTIKITNNLTVAEISKKSAVNGEEVPGAKLQILDKDKKEISCKIKNAKGKLETLDKCEWTSTEEPMSIVGLPAGKYYLVETLAPKGYELNPNSVEFEIKADGKVTSVEMVDQIEVDVPNTLSARSSLLLAVAMVDIALGIGIITYVKKNKVEE